MLSEDYFIQCGIETLDKMRTIMTIIRVGGMKEHTRTKRCNGMSSTEIDIAVSYSEFQYVFGTFTIWCIMSPSGGLAYFLLLLDLLVSFIDDG